tara:strand:- start:795 stop:2000 length:1206 start_codon:yes stop_codon:yes gene_type:complete
MPRTIKGDWISAYLKYTEETESPKSYHTWTAIACIAGALARKVYFKIGSLNVYPNFFTMLVGSSGKLRKGAAMGVGEDLFRQLNLDMAAEAITREALLIRMSKASRNFMYPDGSQGVHSSLTLFSKELTTLTGVQNNKFLADLTDWYDCHEVWTNDTKNKGTDTIEGMYLNILAATAPDWIPQILPIAAVGGGFTSRCIFIVETEKYKILPMPPPLDAQLRLSLIEDLKDIRGITGQYVFDDDATNKYNAWYVETETKKKDGVYALQDPRLYSYCERRAVHLFKLCMVICAATTSERVISVDMLERALGVLEAAEQRMSGIFVGVGLNELAQKQALIMSYLKTHGNATREEVLVKYYRDINITDLENIERSMCVMGVIDVIPLMADGAKTCRYIWKDKGHQ